MAGGALEVGAPLAPWLSFIGGPTLGSINLIITNKYALAPAAARAASSARLGPQLLHFHQSQILRPQQLQAVSLLPYN